MKKGTVKNPFGKIGELINKIRSFWIFSDYSKDLSKKEKVLYWLVNAAIILVAVAGLGFCSLLLAYGPSYSPWVFIGYLKSFMILALNLFPPLVIFLLLYAAIGKAWIAYIIDSVIVMGFSVANFFLLKFRDDPLMILDVIHFREAAAISKEGYSYEITPRMWFCLFVLVACTLFLYIFSGYKPKKKARIIIAAVTVLASVLSSSVYVNNRVYNKMTLNEKHIVKWSPTQVYISKGFVYPFLNSFKELGGNEPDGYNAQEVAQKLSAFETKDIPDDKKVNFIGIMLEAFCDLQSLGVEGIDKSVYNQYNVLKSENYSGKLITNIFAGGTIDSERAFLTGYQDLSNYRTNVNSYVRYFKSQGYVTDGSHPSEDWFYNRKNVNNYLGFDSYRFKENHFEEKYGVKMRLDSVVFNDFFENYKKITEETGKPYFGFHVTYQGHGPYNVNSRNWDTDEIPLYYNDEISEQSENIVNNYCGSIKDTSYRLNQFVKKIKNQKEPIVLVVFGDHKPWLGDGNSVYKELGINLDVSTKEGFENYYSTDYIIIANDAAKAVLGNEFKGKGPTTSPCFLMNEVFDLMGYEGPSYMQYTNTIREFIPVINDMGLIDNMDYFYVNGGTYAELQAILDDYKKAAYHESTNFRENEQVKQAEALDTEKLKQKYEQVISNYEDADIPAEKKVSIINLALESFCDLQALGVEGISSSVYSMYNALKADGHWGTLIAPEFENLSQVERTFLTGYRTLGNAKDDLNSYVRYFENQGYVVDGGYPSEAYLNNRQNMMEYMGFDDYRFADNYFEEKYGTKMRLDSTLMEDILENYKVKTQETGKPYFGFYVSRQGFGPYYEDRRDWGTEANPLYHNPDISEEANNILNNYLGSVKDTTWRLNQLCSELNKIDEPVILVAYGTNKPVLGENNSVYSELGINLDVNTVDGFMNAYSTEYIIVANDAAKAVLGNDFRGNGYATSSSFLLSKVADMMGIEGSAFMQYVSSVNESIMAINKSGVIDAQGNFYTHDTIPAQVDAVVDEYSLVSFYDVENFRQDYEETEDAAAKFDHAARVDEILSEYTDADISKDKKVNVVGIMLEAFSDLNMVGITGIDSSVYEGYNYIKSISYSGLLINNVFGEEPTTTERTFLTGFHNNDIENSDIENNVNSYVRYFKDQGYYIDGSIPFDSWQYNREAVNNYFGFKDYRYSDNYFNSRYGSQTGLDSVLFEDILTTLNKKTKSSKPYFGFHVTCQGKGRYSDTVRSWGTDVNPMYNNPEISEASNNILNNYLGAARDTSWRLSMFVEQVRTMKEPVVLVIFGNHKPWLGDDESVYKELGVNLDPYSAQGFINRYSTEYIIYANDAAKAVLGNDVVGRGPSTSPSFLMNKVLEFMGSEGPAYMQYTDKVDDTVSAMNDFGIIDSNVSFYYTDIVPPEADAICDEYKYVSHFYSKKSVK